MFNFLKKNNNDKSEYEKFEETLSEAILDIKTEIDDLRGEIRCLKIFNKDIDSKIDNYDSEIKEILSAIKKIKYMIADAKRLYMNESGKSDRKRIRKLTKAMQEDRYRKFKTYWLNNPELSESKAYKECGLPGTNSTMVYIDQRVSEDNLRAVISAKRKDIKERK